MTAQTANLAETLLEKLQVLPPDKQQQAIAFVEFLIYQQTRSPIESSHQAKSSVKEIMAMARQFAELPEIDRRTSDEILGYDEYGVPQ